MAVPGRFRVLPSQSPPLRISPFPCNKKALSAKKSARWRFTRKGEGPIRIFSISLICLAGVSLSIPSQKDPVVQSNQPVEEQLVGKIIPTTTKDKDTDKKRTKFPQQEWEILNPYTAFLYVEVPDSYQPSSMEYFVQQESLNDKVANNAGAVRR